MNYNGTIRLISHDKETVLHSFVYVSREERKKIVDRWKKVYEDHFYLYYLSIIPNVVTVVKRKSRRPKAYNNFPILEE